MVMKCKYCKQNIGECDSSILALPVRTKDGIPVLYKNGTQKNEHAHKSCHEKQTKENQERNELYDYIRSTWCMRRRRQDVPVYLLKKLSEFRKHYTYKEIRLFLVTYKEKIESCKIKDWNHFVNLITMFIDNYIDSFLEEIRSSEIQESEASSNSRYKTNKSTTAKKSEEMTEILFEI